ncbi:MAG: hypothetical protein ACFCU8_09130 [Thermosynechococcaceae cyanobacterium]
MEPHMIGMLLQSSWVHWLDQGAESYLNITWWVAHPFGMVVAVVVLLVLAQAILGLVSNFIKQLLLLIVKSPYLLLQWVLAKSSRSLNLPTMTLKSPSLKRQETGNIQERLLKVLTQLEATKQEQEKILKELKSLLAHHQQQATMNETVSPASKSATTKPTAPQP